MKTEELLKRERLRKFANDTLRKHGLEDWTFGFDNRCTRRLGLCSYSKKRVSVSAKFVPLLEWEKLVDTVLHEIAHAMTPKAGHGAVWKEACMLIGAQPNACYKEDKVPKEAMESLSNWQVVCEKCGKHICYRTRRPNKNVWNRRKTICCNAELKIVRL